MVLLFYKMEILMKEIWQNFIFQNVDGISLIVLLLVILILYIFAGMASRKMENALRTMSFLVLAIPWGVLFYGKIELKSLYVDVGNNHIVRAYDDLNSFTILKQVDVIKKEIELSEELLQNGLTTVKRIEKDLVVQEEKFVLKVKCNSYSYKMCIEKIKSNLDNIISSSKKSDGFTVVDL